MKLVVLCTVETGLDAIAEVLRNGHSIECIVGVNPAIADPIVISGFVDVAKFANKWNIPFLYVERYDLKSEADKKALLALKAELIWVSGWQRLVPEWLIESTAFGVLGGHGSPDGIQGGRGRSPQNWAILLGCKRFDLALFKITPGIDDGPIIAVRSFFYNQTDDISISYKKTALCMAEMIIEVLNNPSLLNSGKPQGTNNAHYFPQRLPEDGFIDWNLNAEKIWALCRSLTKPYPGCRTLINEETEIVIWDCVPFDELLENKPGIISFVFEDGTFLVNCGDGRMLIKSYELSNALAIIQPGQVLISKSEQELLKVIISRHELKHPHNRISQRLSNQIRE
jgi:methionyl-tRNA formyltransferase